jgi:hypothetical protein
MTAQKLLNKIKQNKGISVVGHPEGEEASGSGSLSDQLLRAYNHHSALPELLVSFFHEASRHLLWYLKHHADVQSFRWINK